MRDKIAAILWNYAASAKTAHEVADAIIAALPDMVEELEWEKLSEKCFRCSTGGELNWRCESYNNGEWYLTFSVPGYCNTLIEGRWETAEAAIAVANAYHVAQVMQAFGVKL